MASWLRQLTVEEGSLVDSPANPLAKMVLFKRAKGDAIEKRIREEGGKFVVYNEDYSEKLGSHATREEAEAQLRALEANKEKKTMPFKGALSPEAKEYVEALEKKVGELEAKIADGAVKNADPEEVLKSLPEAVRKLVEDARNRAAEAEKVAKTERDKRETAELIDLAKTKLGRLAGTPEEKAALLKSAREKLDAETAAKIEATLAAASEAIEKSALFVEKGSDRAVATSATVKIEAKAEEMVRKGEFKTKAQAIEAVAKQNPDLYAEHVREMRERAK